MLPGCLGSFSFPRLRISRRFHRTHLDSRHDDAFETPQAGPSRLSPRAYAQDAQSEGDEDAELTPKILSKPQLDDPVGSSSRAPLSDANFNSDNPTLRLRAILARMSHAKSDGNFNMSVKHQQLPWTLI